MGVLIKRRHGSRALGGLPEETTRIKGSVGALLEVRLGM